jgi:hypothetical protein
VPEDPEDAREERLPAAVPLDLLGAQVCHDSLGDGQPMCSSHGGVNGKPPGMDRRCPSPGITEHSIKMLRSRYPISHPSVEIGNKVVEVEDRGCSDGQSA